MAEPIVITCRVGTIFVGSDGGTGGTEILLEEPGDLTFTVPNAYRHVVDRNANTWTIVQRPDEVVAGKFSFLYSDQDGNKFGNLWALLNGTLDIRFVVDLAADITHTFYRVTGSVEFAEATDGSKATLSFESAGWNDGVNSYGKITA